MEKDYLDFDELITFLDQKGYKRHERRTNDLLLEAITDSKLTPVFFYKGELTVTYAKFVRGNEWEEVKKDTCRLQGYFSANAYDLVDLYHDYFTCVPNFLTLNGQHVRPYKIFGNPAPTVTDHQKIAEGIEVCFLHLKSGSVTDGYSHTVSDFLYPVEQLEKMFNQSSHPLALHYHQEVKELRQKIADLEQQLEKKLESTDRLSDRNEKSYQTTIGLMLELMTIPKKQGDRPPFSSEAVIIGKITDKGIYGQGKTTLETRFSDAKTTLDDVKKRAFRPK